MARWGSSSCGHLGLWGGKGSSASSHRGGRLRGGGGQDSTAEEGDAEGGDEGGVGVEEGVTLTA